MSNFHKNHPWGKGFWIWELKNCEGGNIDSIIAKCKKYNVDYVIVKTSDGENLFPNNTAAQLTKEMSDKFHANGIGIYSWSYNYGKNPQREAALALYSLEQLGVDGHVFDAESEWEALPNPGQAAESMFSIIRQKQPDAFLAHAPYPIIDYHTRFAYVEFGKYCNAIMPQMYHGTMGVSVEKSVNTMFAQWSKWERSWAASGHGDSIKPIIPLGQVYDNPQTNFVETPEQLKEFISRLYGYGSVNFWSWQHMQRSDLWEALRDAGVKPKAELETSQETSQNQTQPESSTTIPEVPSQPTPPTQEPAASTSVEEPKPAEPAATTGVLENPTPSTPEVPASVPPIVVPTSDNGKTTITVEKDEDHPDGVKIEIRIHKRHVDYFIEFIRSLAFWKKGGATQ